MKSLALIVLLGLILWPALAGEITLATTSTSASRPAAVDEKLFRDPFATEGEQAKAQAKIKDPLQPLNRAFFHFNDKLYFWVLKPAAKGYSKVVPRPARTCVGRFFANVKYPIHLVNNLLQGKFKSAGLETGRFRGEYHGGGWRAF